MTAPDFLTVAEVAASMRVSKMTVYRLLDSGRMRGYRMGRSIRVDVRDLTAFLRSVDTTADLAAGAS